MNAKSEQAEAYLRLLAEAELRRTATRAQDRLPNLALVSNALCEAGAIDVRVAREIRSELELAQAMRLRESSGAAGTGQARLSPAALGRLDRLAQFEVARATEIPVVSGHGAGQGGEVRAMPVGHVVAMSDGESGSWICLLGYLQSGAGAWFTVAGWMPRLAAARKAAPPHSAGMQPAQAIDPRLPFRQLAGEDDRGVRYQFGYEGGSRPGHPWLQGVLRLHPDPVREIRWLDLRAAPDQAAVRIPLDGRVSSPGKAVTGAGKEPGELVLDLIAARILAAAAAFPQVMPEQLAAAKPEVVPHIASGLGDVVAALRAAGALSPSNPGPGRLARLCASVGVNNHSISAPLAEELPGPWQSMLSRYHRRQAYLLPAHGSWAPAVAQLPEVDGVRLAVLGLNQGERGAVLHLHAGGVTPEDDWAYYRGVRPLPVLWIRDSAGHWHTTLTDSWSPLADGTAVLRLAVVPPLEAGISWIEMSASGRSAEIRVSLPLRWR